jgi:hypothetical protein
MPSTGPTVRASHLKDSVEAFGKLGPAAEERIRAQVPPSSLALIAEATRSEWIPVAINAELAEAVHAAAGEEGARLWGRELFLKSVTTFLRPLLETVKALFDPSPAAICRFAPHAWLALYHEAGTLQLSEVGEDHLHLALIDFPEPLRRMPYLMAFAGTLEAIFAICAYTGTVEIVPPADGADPGFLMRWARRSA